MAQHWPEFAGALRRAEPPARARKAGQAFRAALQAITPFRLPTDEQLAIASSGLIPVEVISQHEFKAAYAPPIIGCSACQRPLFCDEFPTGGCVRCVRELLERIKWVFTLGSVARPEGYRQHVRILPAHLQPHLVGRV